MNELFKSEYSEKISTIEIAAIQLSLSFLEEKDIPYQYKQTKKRSQKVKRDSMVQVRFKEHVNDWNNTISNILKNIDSEQAWRFINLKPKAIENIKSVTEHQDFNDFTDYFILRRDIQSCDYAEIGCLAQLHTSFQKEIEKTININKPDFVAIDFEHATRHKGTVCSVGIVLFKNGEIIDEYYTRVKPPKNEYEWATTRVHHLNSTHTENSPSFIEIFPEIKKRIDNNVIVAHGAFHTDKHCLEQAIELNSIDDKLNLNWVCTESLCESSLNIACEACNIDLDHHQALSDARACGFLYNLYLKKELPYDLIQEKKNNKKEIAKDKESFFPRRISGEVLKPDFKNAKNKNNPFFMKKVVVSGFENNLKERLAIELKELGADVDTSVGKKTNYLIIGDNAGPSKLKKMKINIEEGKEAAIITLEEYEILKKQHIDNSSALH
jgi:DNA polymerase-3 subunit epsilon